MSLTLATDGRWTAFMLLFTSLCNPSNSTKTQKNNMKDIYIFDPCISMFQPQRSATTITELLLMEWCLPLPVHNGAGGLQTPLSAQEVARPCLIGKLVFWWASGNKGLLPPDSDRHPLANHHYNNLPRISPCLFCVTWRICRSVSVSGLLMACG